jgi:hypothetical protein
MLGTSAIEELLILFQLEILAITAYSLLHRICHLPPLKKCLKLVPKFSKGELNA